MIEKLKSREFLFAILTTVIFLASLFGLGVDTDQVTKVIAGITNAVSIAAFTINRAIVKASENRELGRFLDEYSIDELVDPQEFLVN